MDDRDLAVVLAVAREGTVTAAAAALHVSQPALSKRLRSVEAELGTALFDRTSRGVAPTAAGLALLPHAERALAAWDEASEAVAAVRDAASRRLVVGMSTGLGRGLLPAVRSRLTARVPTVDLVVRQVPWSDATGGLGSGDADVAFLWEPLPASCARLLVAEEDRHVALPAAHPLAGRERLRFADLAGEPFLALPASAGPLRDHWLARDERGGLPRIGAEVSSLDETHEALLDGRGVVLLAAGNAPLLTRDGVVTRPVDGLGASRLVLAWRVGDDRPLVRAYVDAVSLVVTRTPEGEDAG